MVEGKAGEALGATLWNETLAELSFADVEGILEAMKA